MFIRNVNLRLCKTVSQAGQVALRSSVPAALHPNVQSENCLLSYTIELNIISLLCDKNA